MSHAAPHVHRPRPRPRTRPRRGYVLIVTLAVLTLAAASMVAVGRASITRAADARAAQDELQRRWGVISTQKAVLPFAEEVLQRLEIVQRRALPSYRTSIVLGRQTFNVVVGDEQAKANVNQLLDQLDARRTEDRLRQSLGGIARSSVKLRAEPLPTDSSPGAPARRSVARPLRPQRTAPQTQPQTADAATSQPAAAAPAVPRRVSGYGQIFGGPSGEVLPPQQLIGMPGVTTAGTTSRGPADVVTCWGNGAINLRRATPAAMRLGTSLAMVQISRLLDARDAWLRGEKIASVPIAAGPSRNAASPGPAAPAQPRSVVARLLGAAGVQLGGADQQPTAALVDQSTCHSVWIIADDGRRLWYHLFVDDQTDAQHPQLDAASW
jgi:hypothetical protein